MLIINADDLGISDLASDNIIACHRQGLITSASAMVFMSDSARAAKLAASAGLETGLHLNLTQPFDGSEGPLRIKEIHPSIVEYFRFRKWSRIIYNPLLGKKLDYVFKAQYDEYCRLFGNAPVKIDGHHHMHLCMNMILGRIIPPGSRVRGNFSFEVGEKHFINRLYRRVVDAWLKRHYCCPDSLFNLEESRDLPKMNRIINLASFSNVELEVHPGRFESYNYLMSSGFRNLIAKIPKGAYSMLPRS